MKKLIYVLLTFLISITIYAQEVPFYKSYKWESKPDYTGLKIDQNEEIISFKDYTSTEFIYDNEGGLAQYDIYHTLVWLNSDDKIEEYNKVYLPYSNRSKLIENKARVITQKGDIIELDDSKVLVATDEESGQQYKYYALEGVEKGSFIEYYYILQRATEYNGKAVYFQDDYPKYNVEFDLLSPKNLLFKIKSYNGLKEIERDTLSKEKLHWVIKADSIPKLEREGSAPYNTLCKHLVYKLDSNLYSRTYDISSFGNVATNIYNYYFKSITKKDLAVINKINSKIGINDSDKKEAKIRKIENYLKENIYVVRNVQKEELSDIKSIWSSKTASESGFIKLFVNCVKAAELNVEIVLTSNRMKNKLDKDFEASNFLTEVLLYFPQVKQFTSPETISYRLGYPAPKCTDNYGLFVKEVKVGEYLSGVGKVKYIKASLAKDNIDQMDLNVSFDKEDMTKNAIDITASYYGYNALQIQPYLKIINEKQRKEILEAFVKATDEDITILGQTVTNESMETFPEKPLVVNSKTESTSFVSNAGDKYLFQLGKLIGPQMEMYQEKERILPYESTNTRTYKRTIVVNIPEGYKFSNLEDINIHNSYEEEGKKLMEFHSHYKLEGNKLIVYADEFYDLVIIKPSIFEEYRKIINNAADFNKITLVLEKK